MRLAMLISRACGVRARNRRIEGSTADIDAGTVKLADGQAENVKLAKPVFVVEPSGRYRASADPVLVAACWAV